ncbi:MAG TPA: patatin-like phospholipase family protein [Xanthobacteraceae bacterium]|nr:patatin-like phospholipase family protein [Xanthobacteraceae bacterium]
MVFLAWKRKREAEIEAEPVDRQEPKAARPTIGLALGGGAARGWAHIGVVRRLVAAGIAPDVIAGTSIGALVGGAHACGRLDDLESWAREMTKRRVFGLLDFRFGGAGLIGGGRLAQLLRDSVGDTAIEDLPIRYAAIATELSTGHEIWLTRGSLVDAIRASYALPAIFPPVKVAGRWLMDGAMVNPIPVSAARALGARVVIAVNLNADVFGRGTVIQDHGVEPEVAAEAMAEPEAEESRFGKVLRLVRRQAADYDGPRGISSVMVDAFNITQDRIARSRLAGDPPDVMVAPRLGKIGLFQFHHAEDVIRLGEEAVERALPEINEAIAALG